MITIHQGEPVIPTKAYDSMLPRILVAVAGRFFQLKVRCASISEDCPNDDPEKMSLASIPVLLTFEKI